jgi:hypothetical protein
MTGSSLLSPPRQAQTMKIINLPLPPFSKGGLGGFGPDKNSFGHLELLLEIYLGFGI